MMTEEEKAALAKEEAEKAQRAADDAARHAKMLKLALAEMGDAMSLLSDLMLQGIRDDNQLRIGQCAQLLISAADHVSGKSRKWDEAEANAKRTIDEKTIKRASVEAPAPEKPAPPRDEDGRLFARSPNAAQDQAYRVIAQGMANGNFEEVALYLSNGQRFIYQPQIAAPGMPPMEPPPMPYESIITPRDTVTPEIIEQAPENLTPASIEQGVTAMFDPPGMMFSPEITAPLSGQGAPIPSPWDFNKNPTVIDCIHSIRMEIDTRNVFFANVPDEMNTKLKDEFTQSIVNFLRDVVNKAFTETQFALPQNLYVKKDGT